MGRGRQSKAPPEFNHIKGSKARRRAYYMVAQRCTNCGKPTYGYSLTRCKKCIRKARRKHRKDYRQRNGRKRLPLYAARQAWLASHGLSIWYTAHCTSRTLPKAHYAPDGSIVITGMLPISEPVVVEKRRPADPVPTPLSLLKIEPSVCPTRYVPPTNLFANLD